MNKEFLVAVFAATISTAALAAPPSSTNVNNVGSCGWGSKVFEGQRGVAPQSLAATTNGLGSQTFGITSGTSGCTQDGMVTSNWKTALFIDGNKEKLARDMSMGGGETLDSLAQLIGVQDQHKPSFFRLAKHEFGTIFASDSASTEQVMAGLKRALANDAELSRYSTSI